MRTGDIYLIALYSILIISLIIRILLESTHYISPDSIYYLQIAQNLLSGKGLVMTNPQNMAQTIKVTTWPAGYPLLIAAFSWITDLPLMWNSKFLNFTLIGGSFLLIRIINKNHAWFLCLSFFSFTLLEVYSYTWSETSFLFFLLAFVIALYKCELKDFSFTWLILLILSSIGLFMSRYIGVFALAVLGLLLCFNFYHKKYTNATRLVIALCVASTFIMLYLYNNYLIDGNLTGPRTNFEHPQSTIHFMSLFIKGLINECMIFRHSYFNGSTDYLFYGLAFFQFTWLAYIFITFKKKYMTVRLPLDLLSKLLFLTGICYILLLIILRISKPFDAPDFRLLSPLTFPVLLGLLHYVSTYKNFFLIKQITALFIVSLLLNVLKPSFIMTVLKYLQ